MSDKDDPLAFLDGEAPADEGQAKEPEQAEATVEAPSEDSEGESPEDTGEAAPPPGADGDKPEAENRGAVPISALLDEREKRQKLERELEEFRKKAEAQRSNEAAPDPGKDPQGYQAYRDRQFEQRLWNERLNMSEVMTRQAQGDELVDEATKAFQQAVNDKPWLAQELQRQPNPYGYVVEWHRQQKLLSEIGSDPEKWREAERERLKAELQAEMQQPSPAAAQQQPPALGIPRSLAKAPAAGSDAASSTPTSGFESLFPE